MRSLNIKNISICILVGLHGGAYAEGINSPASNYISPVVQVGGVTPSGSLNQVMSFIANQLANNRNIENVTGTRIAIGSFVNISNLEETDKLGMAIAENLMHEMHVRGFGIVDFKTRDALRVRQNGDYVFSRDVADLKRNYDIHYFLSGTVSRNADGAVINARLVQADTSLVVSTAQGFVPNANLDKLFAERYGAVEKVSVGRTGLSVKQVNIK